MLDITVVWVRRCSRAEDPCSVGRPRQAHVGRSRGERRPIGGHEIRDTTIAGGQFRGGTSSFGLSLEAAYLRSSASGRSDDTAIRLTFSAERRLAQDLWMTVSFGGDRGADHATNKGLSVLSVLKWGFARDPALASSQE
jgi:hypothetical protein